MQKLTKGQNGIELKRNYLAKKSFMNILLLGAGGREHAFAYKIAQSKHCKKLFIAPGNPGTAQFGENITISATDFPAIKNFVLDFLYLENGGLL